MSGLLFATVAIVAVGASSCAIAADLPVKARPAPVPPPAVAFNWTGFYVGGHVGYGWSRKEWTAIDVTDNGVTETRGGTVDGFLGGAQVGYNWQVNRVVLGVEGDFSWADLVGNTCDPRLFLVTCHSKVDWLGTLTARIGGTADRALLYLKGGVAWVHDNHALQRTLATASFSDTRAGWTVGAGIEYAFAPNWSAKLEYNYVDFGTDRIATTVGVLTPGTVTLDLEQRLHVVKAGANYRFGWGGPLVTKY